MSPEGKTSKPVRRKAAGAGDNSSAEGYLDGHLLIAMPVMGWVVLSAEGDPVPFFGLTLPPLVAPDEGLAERVEGLHTTVGAVGYWLIGLHAAASLFHHYVLRDGTLRRMLPGLP